MTMLPLRESNSDMAAFQRRARRRIRMSYRVVAASQKRPTKSCQSAARAMSTGRISSNQITRAAAVELAAAAELAIVIATLRAVMWTSRRSVLDEDTGADRRFPGRFGQ